MHHKYITPYDPVWLTWKPNWANIPCDKEAKTSEVLTSNTEECKADSLCPKCKGTGILDFRFYTRKCECCLGE